MALPEEEEIFNQGLQQASRGTIDPELARSNAAVQAGFDAGLEDEQGVVVPLDPADPVATQEALVDPVDPVAPESPVVTQAEPFEIPVAPVVTQVDDEFSEFGGGFGTTEDQFSQFAGGFGSVSSDDMAAETIKKNKLRIESQAEKVSSGQLALDAVSIGDAKGVVDHLVDAAGDFGKEIKDIKVAVIGEALETVAYMDNLSSAEILEKLAGRTNRGFMFAFDMIQSPLSVAMWGATGSTLPSFVGMYDEVFPLQDNKFEDADDLLIDDVLNIGGTAAEFVAAGGPLNKAAALAAREFGAATGTPKLGTQIHDDVISSKFLTEGARIDALAGVGFEGTQSVLGKDAHVSSLVNSILLPVLSTRAGRGATLNVAKATVPWARRATTYAAGGPIAMIAGEMAIPFAKNGLDHTAETIARKAGENPEAFAKGAGKYTKAASDFWIKQRVGEVNVKAVTDSMQAWSKAILNMEDPKVQRRKELLTATEDRVNSWVSASGRTDLKPLVIPTNIGYKGVSDSALLDTVAIGIRNTYPEAHLVATRERTATVQSYIESVGASATKEDQALLRSMYDELEVTLETRAVQDLKAISPKFSDDVSQVSNVKGERIADAGQLRKSIESVRDMRENAYVEFTNLVDKNIELSPEIVLKEVENLLAQESKEVFRTKEQIPTWVHEVFNGVKQGRAEVEAVLTPAQTILRERRVAVDKAVDHSSDLRIQHDIANINLDAKVAHQEAIITKAASPSAVTKAKATLKSLKTERTAGNKQLQTDIAKNARATRLARRGVKDQSKVVEAESKVTLKDAEVEAVDYNTLLPTNTGEVMDTIKVVNRLIRETGSSQSVDTHKLQSLNKIKDALINTMTTLKGTPSGSTAFNTWERGNDFYAREIATQMNASSIGNVFLRKTSDNKNFQFYDSELVGKGWDNASPESIRAVIQGTSGTAETKALQEAAGISTEVTESTSKAVQEDYVRLGMSSMYHQVAQAQRQLRGVSEASVNDIAAMRNVQESWLENNKVLIDEVPGLRTEIDKVMLDTSEFISKVSEYRSFMDVKQGKEMDVLLKTLGHSSNIDEIIRSNEMTRSLAVTREGLITGGIETPALSGVKIPELDTFSRMAGARGAIEFQEVLSRKYLSSKGAGEGSLNIEAISRDLNNLDTRSNMESLFGRDAVDSLEGITNAHTLSGIDSTVTTKANYSANKTGVMGWLQDKAMSSLMNNQQRLASVGSLALRRARGFVPSPEYFATYVATTALKHLGNQEVARLTRSVMENHRALGNLDKDLARLAEQNHIASKVFVEGRDWKHLPASYREKTARDLRLLSTSLGITLSHEDAMGLVNKSIEENGGRNEPRESVEIPDVGVTLKSANHTEDLPEVPEIPEEMIANGGSEGTGEPVNTDNTGNTG